MAETYGEDLRGRVIAAVDGGMSRRAAAERFQVGVSTAIAWVRVWREEGRRVAKPKGGDNRSHRIEAHRAAILGAIEAQATSRLASWRRCWTGSMARASPPARCTAFSSGTGSR